MAVEAETYDVCLSFAGEDRRYVEEVAEELKRAGVRVFYDAYEDVALWGKNLYQHLADVYQNRGRFCVVFLSEAYAGKIWTRHELENAQARAVRENREYLLPARFDDTELPGLANTVAYVDLRSKTPQQFAEMIVRKVAATPASQPVPPKVDRASTEPPIVDPPTPTPANLGTAIFALPRQMRRRSRILLVTLAAVGLLIALWTMLSDSTKQGVVSWWSPVNEGSDLPHTATTATDTTASTSQPPSPGTPNPLKDFKFGIVPPVVAKAAILLPHADRSESGMVNERLGVSEEQYVAEFAPLLRDELSKRGVTVLLQREDRQVVAELRSLNEKIDEYPVVIGLHVNGASTATVTGSEAFISADAPQETKMLADELQRAVVAQLGLRNRGVKPPQRALRQLRLIPRSIQLELFFITNDSDYTRASARKQQLAEALADVIARHLRKVESVNQMRTASPSRGS